MYLSLPEGGALTTAPGIDLSLVFAHRRPAAEPWDTRLSALLKRVTAMIDAAVLLL
jgi:hypothetical protein